MLFFENSQESCVLLYWEENRIEFLTTRAIRERAHTSTSKNKTIRHYKTTERHMKKQPSQEQNYSFSTGEANLPPQACLHQLESNCFPLREFLEQADSSSAGCHWRPWRCALSKSSKTLALQQCLAPSYVLSTALAAGGATTPKITFCNSIQNSFLLLVLRPFCSCWLSGWQ